MRLARIRLPRPGAALPQVLAPILLLVSPLATAADPPALLPSRFTPVISSIPVREVGLPETIRTDGRDFLVVPWRGRSHLLGARRRNRGAQEGERVGT